MNSAIDILLVEDNSDDELLIREFLRTDGGTFELRVERDLASGMDALRRGTYDVVLLDLMLPDSSGLQTFTEIKAAAGTVPVVVITGARDEALGLQAVKAGADDYFIKGNVHGALVWRSLRHAVERRRASRRIEFQAQLLDQIGQAVVATDTSGIIQYWNAAAQTMFGWSAAEAMGRSLPEVMPMDVSGDAAGAPWEADAATETWSGEVATRRRDGTLLLMYVTLSSLRDPAGSVIGRIGVSADITERRLAENALRESERRLRLFVDAMPTVLWTTDRDLRITSIEGAALAAMGGLAQSAVGRDLSEFTQGRDIPLSAKAIAGEAVSANAEWGGFAFDVHIEPVRDDGGEIIGTIGIALDVTERRRLEQDAAQYFDLLRTIVDAAPLAIIVVDENDLVSLWNGAAERMFGWRSTEVIGRPPPHVPADLKDDLTDTCVNVRRTGTPQKAVVSRVTKDGGTLSVDITMAPVFGPDGRYHGTMGIAEDVTQQRLSAELQERLTATIEASPDFVGTFDSERRAHYINRAGRELIGLPVDGAASTTLEQISTESTAALLEREALPRALAEGAWAGEASLRTSAGESILVWLTLVAHRGGDGDVAFISAVAQDISERRFLEEQLRQSQKMEAVGRLAGGVAHDFNNLLTAIAGHAELLLDDLGENAEVRSDIEEILRAVDRAATLTRQLLAFSRKQVLQPKLLDVSQIVTDLGRILRRLIGRDVRLVSNPGVGIPRVRADRSQIEQVIVNLVVNARDALPRGGTIEISTSASIVTEGSVDATRGVAPGRYTEIAVRDDGIGMDDTLLSRIFEPFFTTKEQGKGTGIGLAAVYGIVTQTGGRILVDSVTDGGSTFRVLLPQAGDAVPEDPAVGGTKVGSGGTETVLLVEDESAVRRLGRRILERRGYQVIEAESGAEAISLFQRMAPDIALLVSDVVMPGMSGGELARRLRIIKPSLRILFTSGYTADAIAPNGELEAGTAFLEKPFTPDALAQKVRDVLDEPDT
jgi:PAS domain S-box-containing protein